MFKVLQVWDAVTGAKQYTFEGHEAPVYSVCPHHKESIQVIIYISVYVCTCAHMFIICLNWVGPSKGKTEKKENKLCGEQSYM